MKLFHFLILVLVMSIMWQFSFKADAPIRITPLLHTIPNALSIGWVGDMVPSENELYIQSAFTATASYLSEPDFMIGNLEGTFAHTTRVSKCVYLMLQCHAFRGHASFADTLKATGFDMVSLVNNHSYDFGDAGLKDTEAELDRIGMPYISPTKPTAMVLVKGKRIGVLGLSSTPPLETINDYAFITKKVTELRASSDLVVVIFHGGAEGSDKTIVPGVSEYMGTENRGNVELVAHTAIDAGADLILGSGPHVLRKVEIYKGKPIAYSMGNFVGGGKLISKGVLSISGIFTATFIDTTPTAYDITSVLLSKEGIPALDPTDQGKKLIESLSR